MVSRPPEDILADVLPALIGQSERLWHGAPGDHYVHPSTGVVVSPPDILAKNWTLHASAIWSSAIFLADHLDELGIRDAPGGTRVIELGAGAGLPGIAVAKLAPQTEVWLTDFPDALILKGLADNVRLNNVERNCRVYGLAWGSDTWLAQHPSDARDDVSRETAIEAPAFDLILAADTLWNPETQPLLCDTLCRLLRNAASPDARAVLVAGMHTGRYALQKFITLVQDAGLEVCDLRERRLHPSPNQGENDRPWTTERPMEDEAARRQWVLWLVLKHCQTRPMRS